MVELFEQFYQRLGPIGFAAVFAAIGSALGFAIGRFSRRGSEANSSPTQPEYATSAKASEVTPTVESKGSKAEKRRNPRRPGRSVEVYVVVPGQTDAQVKGVVLNRSVGGLGLLVGDEYPIGTAIGVLPVSASQLTPWVEVEVKTCRPSGEDWEIGVQFLKLPPYSTMVLFG